jgi:hypothetical protein
MLVLCQKGHLKKYKEECWYWKKGQLKRYWWQTKESEEKSRKEENSMVLLGN